MVNVGTVTTFFSGSGFCLPFCSVIVALFIKCLYVQESRLSMFEMSKLHQDSLREYDELQLSYSESGLLLIFIRQ